jgi:hypothetical protein
MHLLEPCMEAHHRAMEAHHGAMEAHHGAVEAHLRPGRFTLSHEG